MRRLAIGAALALLGLVLLAVFVAGTGGTGGSTYNPRGDGLLAALRYLERRGVAVERWQRPASRLPLDRDATLVLAAPWSVPHDTGDLVRLDAFLGRGGRIVYLASGGNPGPAELRFAAHFEIWPVASGEAPPWSYGAWRAWRQQPVPALATTRGREAGLPPRIALRRGESISSAAENAERLYVDGRGVPRMVRRRVGRGELIVIDNAGVFSNALLGEPGNLELLEWLAARAAPGPLLFDEWIHGRREPGLGAPGNGGALLALVLHLAAVYLAVVWALSRRFGRPIPDEGPPRGSVARDLEALALLHRRAGHARGAGRALAEAVRTLGSDTDGGRIDFELPSSERELLDAARRVGERQRSGRL